MQKGKTIKRSKTTEWKSQRSDTLEQEPLLRETRDPAPQVSAEVFDEEGRKIDYFRHINGKADESTAIVYVLRDFLRMRNIPHYELTFILTVCLFAAQFAHMGYVLCDLMSWSINGGVKFFACLKMAVNLLLVGNVIIIVHRMRSKPPSTDPAEKRIGFLFKSLLTVKWANLFFAVDCTLMVGRLLCICELVDTRPNGVSGGSECMSSVIAALVIVILYCSLLVPANFDTELHKYFIKYFVKVNYFHKFIHVIVPTLAVTLLSSLGLMDEVSKALFVGLVCNLMLMGAVTYLFEPKLHLCALLLCVTEIELLFCFIHQMDLDYSMHPDTVGVPCTPV
eukprot:gene17860-20341_t